MIAGDDVPPHRGAARRLRLQRLRPPAAVCSPRTRSPISRWCTTASSVADRGSGQGLLRHGRRLRPRSRRLLDRQRHASEEVPPAGGRATCSSGERRRSPTSCAAPAWSSTTTSCWPSGPGVTMPCSPGTRTWRTGPRPPTPGPRRCGWRSTTRPSRTAACASCPRPSTSPSSELHVPQFGDRGASHALGTELRPGDEVVPVPIRRGDVTVHNERVMHGSGGNSTDGFRRAYVLAFRAAETVRTERALGFTHSHNDAGDVLDSVGVAGETRRARP